MQVEANESERLGREIMMLTHDDALGFVEQYSIPTRSPRPWSPAQNSLVAGTFVP